MDTQLSPWWKRSLILLIVSGFSILGYLAARTYRDAPPIPRRVVDPAGATLFTRQDIIAGQQVFLSHGLMENGTIWGHGAYLGPDFSAEYLHTMALDILASVLAKMSPHSVAAHPNDPDELDAEVARTLKENRYEPTSDTLTFTEAEADSFRKQQLKWRDYFSAPGHNGGLTAGLIQKPEELRNMTAFFAWAGD
jgi:nitric oxide reductase subunit B